MSKPSIKVFDRSVKLAQRRRAALDPDHSSYDYLRDEVASRLVDRLGDINRCFQRSVEIGCGSGAHVSKILQQVAEEAKLKPPTAPTPHQTPLADESTSNLIASLPSVPGRGEVHHLTLTDSCAEALQHTKSYWAANQHSLPPYRTHEYLLMDEEAAFPFPDGSLDLIVSNLCMHWINDLPTFLKRCRQALKPDGVFLATMLGGATLQELRSSMTIADMERLGGVMPHVSPFVYGRDCGDLLSAAGFALPTVDTDVLTLRYPDLFTLVQHLRGMGETNCVLQRPKAVSRDVFISADAAYHSLYADEEGLLPATFQVFYLIGWAPHADQPKPLRRGSAKAKLSDLDKVAKQQQQPQQHTVKKNDEEGTPFVE